MSETEGGSRYYHCEMLLQTIAKAMADRGGDTRGYIVDMDIPEASILTELLEREMYLAKREHQFVWILVYDPTRDVICAAPSRFMLQIPEKKHPGVIAIVPHRSDLADELWNANYRDVMGWLSAGNAMSPPRYEVNRSLYDEVGNRKIVELKRA